MTKNSLLIFEDVSVNVTSLPKKQGKYYVNFSTDKGRVRGYYNIKIKTIAGISIGTANEVPHIKGSLSKKLTGISKAKQLSKVRKIKVFKPKFYIKNDKTYKVVNHTNGKYEKEGMIINHHIIPTFY